MKQSKSWLNLLILEMQDCKFLEGRPRKSIAVTETINPACADKSAFSEMSGAAPPSSPWLISSRCEAASYLPEQKPTCVSGAPVSPCQAAMSTARGRTPAAPLFSEQDVPPLATHRWKMHMREKGKRPLLLKRTPSGRESRASCQGTTFHFPDMRLRQERGGGGLQGACVSRSAWDSLARRWEEHVVLILSMGGLEHSGQHWHSVSGEEGGRRAEDEKRSGCSPRLFTGPAAGVSTRRWTHTRIYERILV